MIIGKSLTALGGGGLKPEIRVTAKAGALLNLHYKDSTIILQSYQLGAEETQHTFVVSVSETAYVVEDVTNGKSVEVLVDAVAQYVVDISRFDGVIYENGTEYVTLTYGTYGGNGYAYNTGSNLSFGYSGGGNVYGGYITTTEQISMGDFSKVEIDWECSYVYISGGSYGVNVFAVLNNISDEGIKFGGYTGTFSRRKNTYSLNGLTGDYCLAVNAYGANLNVYSIKLI